MGFFSDKIDSLSDEELIVGSMAFGMSILSLFCSSANFLLIKMMKKWNGYMWVLSCMTGCQVCYDVTYWLETSYNANLRSRAFVTGLFYCGGMGVALYTNVLSFIVFYLVYMRSSFDIWANWKYITGFVMLPSVVVFLCVVGNWNNSERSYDIALLNYIVRILSIIVNFALNSFVMYRVGNMITHTAKKVNQRSRCETAILVLANRMLFYPIIQTVTYSVQMVYGPLYRFEPYEGDERDLRFRLALLNSIVSPLAGTLYFLVFLKFQPGAWFTIKRLFFKCLDNVFNRNHTTAMASKDECAEEEQTTEGPKDEVIQIDRAELEQINENIAKDQAAAEAEDPKNRKSMKSVTFGAGILRKLPGKSDAGEDDRYGSGSGAATERGRKSSILVFMATQKETTRVSAVGETEIHKEKQVTSATRICQVDGQAVGHTIRMSTGTRVRFSSVLSAVDQVDLKSHMGRLEVEDLEPFIDQTVLVKDENEMVDVSQTDIENRLNNASVDN